MSNHQSQFDILALMSALADFQLRWAAKQELRKIPILGACMHRTHQVLIDRDSRTQAIVTLRKVKELLHAGISVLFFPEGTRGPDRGLLPFKPGGFAAAVAAGMPVVPITINGSRAILPPGDWKIRSGEIEIVFGEPIPIKTDGNKKAARHALLAQVEVAIATQLSLELPSSAPGLSDSSLRETAAEVAGRQAALQPGQRKHAEYCQPGMHV
jgi:1-acyl-sn-glycerol-3-phosphate acyltransferase